MRYGPLSDRSADSPRIDNIAHSDSVSVECSSRLSMTFNNCTSHTTYNMTQNTPSYDIICYTSLVGYNRNDQSQQRRAKITKTIR